MGRGRRLRSRPVVMTAAATALVAMGAGLYWFQPWKLWQDETVREEFPVVAGETATTGPSKDASVSPGSGASSPAATPAAPRTLATGSFITHEHPTSGTVKIIRLPDGTQTLRLEGLDTSNGPDLRVWLTDAPVQEGKAGWHVFDDGKYQSLGKLKGNKGDQNYALPEGIDLDRYSSVTIWCDRFDVSFGAAELAAA
ncbi:DM13 domain-containing protein [Streptomyces sp. ISL-10]|uniref:DM13 domain-containing protein n=1 Tax=Streptomyces sp. ISL-10 TaxID=2819172 RepID=UPI001BEC91D2|nr:DM13 domain-containing protein [Streptomyces sp. ISL-10]MBT2365675.1 DM13 domain-containing protein [Streptomyces sp. ISL-10]